MNRNSIEREPLHIKLVDVYKQFTHLNTPLEVLKGVHALFHQGESYAITGVSGSGKSTLVHLMAGLDEPTRGQIIINDRPLDQFTPEQRTHFLLHHVGLVFQQPYLIRELSVIENVMLKGLIAGLDPKICKEKAVALLARVGLVSYEQSSIGALSGGQQQRVALARALFNEPPFLLADEPTGNLDATSAGTVIDLLLEARAEWKMGIIIISHDPRVVQRMDSILQLADGLLLPMPNREQNVGNQKVLY